MPSTEQILFQNASSRSIAAASATIGTLATLSASSSSTSANTFAQAGRSVAAIANVSGSINNSLEFSTSATTNDCGADTEKLYPSYFGVLLAVPEWEAILTAMVLSVIIVLTIIGNILVILSVFTYKPLRIVQNFFIVSLAVADLTVALLVLPFNVAYSILGRWEFGIHLCKMWLTCDVLCCTSSILNLCAIALDRYWAITDPINYAQKRTVGRVLLLIAGVWILSLVISSPPLVGWNDWPEEFTNATPCELTSNRGYVIYSSLGSFFIPLVIMTIVYIEIYIATRRRLRERAQASKINTFALKSCEADVAAPSVVGTEKVGRLRSYFGEHCFCGKDSPNIDTPMIQQDLESLSSETNANNEKPASRVEHRVVVVTQKKSRRAKIKDSIKHGKMRSKKRPQMDHPGEHAPETTGSNRLLRAPKDLRACNPSLEAKEGAAEYSEISSESGQTPNRQNPEATVGKACIAMCVDIGDEEGDNLKITPPQYSAGAVSAVVTTIQKKPSGVYQFIEEKQKISLSKERRAARTLGIIMGVFVICWLPFFLMYVILPFCDTCCPTNKFKNFITWLGYINSGLNPVIYTIFNLDYRRAFKRLLGINC